MFVNISGTKYYLILLTYAIAFSTSCQTSKEKSKESEHAEALESVQTSVEIGVYELRTYYAAEGMLENLHSRFRDHTMELFQKHGMVNVGYWTPVNNESNVLIYLLGHRDRNSRDASFSAFRQDPDWIAAEEASEINGRLVDSIQNVFLKPTEFSPSLEIADESPRIFELRTYYTNEGKLDDLHTRFREHTMDIFENNGMKNVVYFDFDDDQQGVESTLLYFITHPSLQALEQNWEGFLDDPEWKSAYEASIQDGSLVESLTSVYLKPTDFSPLK
jgi:hypothetical protein